jgi:uncharacterized protein YbaA (DUF1428 family)
LSNPAALVRRARTTLLKELAMTYVDGFVTAVHTADKETCRAYCHLMGGVFKEHGAPEVVDCWGDDVPPG